ncbi:MAG: 50S ribosomal protein L29 [Candidatus Micrarchaeia archaeon]
MHYKSANAKVLIIKIKEIRAMQDNVLRAKLNELMLEMFAEKRKIAATGVQSKVVKIREIKKSIARINTVFRERGVKE